MLTYTHILTHMHTHTFTHSTHPVHYLLLHHNIHQTLEHVQRVGNSPPVQSTSPVQ